MIDYYRFFSNAVFCVCFAFLISGCSNQNLQSDQESDELILAAYTVPKEVYQKRIIPEFQNFWKEKTGRHVEIHQSYVGSGAQTRAILEGFDADIAALSLEDDIQQLVNKGLITHNWRDRPFNGFITGSVVVIAFRPDNPKHIQDWEDLTRDDVDVVCPNPKTSGGAKWCILAVYGAGINHSQLNTEIPSGNHELINGIAARIAVMNKSGREAVTTFERGVGDVLLTYENEALLRQQQGKDFPFLIPSRTIQIQNPVALIDTHVDRHNTRPVAEAFIDFLHSNKAQAAFAEFGFRPASIEISRRYVKNFPNPESLFTVKDLGGWSHLNNFVFSSNGLWTRSYRSLNR